MGALTGTHFLFEKTFSQICEIKKYFISLHHK